MLEYLKTFIININNIFMDYIIFNIEIPKYEIEDTRPSWVEYYLNLAECVKTRSRDFTKVGAVLVSLKDNRIISTGYNNFKSGMDDHTIDWTDRKFVGDHVIHAEMNVLLYAKSNFEDSILYSTMSPCKDCVKMLSAANVKQIVFKEKYKDFDISSKLMDYFGIKYLEYKN